MSRRIVLITGSGISAESGIATFRGKDGTWNDFDVKKVATYSTWKENFDLVHQFYNDRRANMTSVMPNAAHAMIADWEKRYTISHYTQNVDDLFERAGCTSTVHVHGFITEMKDEACGRIWDIGARAWDQYTEICECGSRRGVKPNVVFFGESAPKYVQMYNDLYTLGPDDFFIAIGSRGEVIPIDYFAKELPCYTIVNTLQDAFDDGVLEEPNWDKVIKDPATIGIHEIDRILRRELDK